jgi:hypothetical protein
MSPADTPDRDEDLVDLLAELETTLTELRGELQTGGRDASEPSDRRNSPDRRDTSDRRPAPDRRRDRSALPRPPSVSELFRFTEQYTLPTLISTLEATIRALELLRGTLRLLDGRSALDDADRRGRSSAARLGDGVAGVGREAVSGVERALSELETALSESEVPNERAGDDLLGEVRSLSAEISERLDTAQDGSQRRSGSQRDQDRPNQGTPGVSERNVDAVTIEVTDSDEMGHDTDDGEAERDPEADDEAERHPEVDIDAELESIRHEVRGTDEPSEPDGDERAGESGTDADPSGDVTEARGDADGDNGSGGHDTTGATSDDTDHVETDDDTEDPDA